MAGSLDSDDADKLMVWYVQVIVKDHEILVNEFEWFIQRVGNKFSVLASNS